MHLSNGLLDNSLCVATGILAAGGIGFAALQAGRRRDAVDRDEVDAGRFGLVTAGVFAAQMLNFSVGDHFTWGDNFSGHVSGHVLGGAAAALLLGPWWGMLSLAVVVTVQCLLFGDGGQSVLGANLLNMAVIAPLSAAACLGLARKLGDGPLTKCLAAACGAWCSVVLAAMFCSAELALSNQVTAWSLAADMVSVHSWIGLGEALATCVLALAIGWMTAVFPSARWAKIGAAAAVLAMALAAPWAASAPDGLEALTTRYGLVNAAAGANAALFQDYLVPSAGEGSLSVVMAALIGLVVCGACATFAARLGRNHRSGV